jgi:transcription initiation factor IIE alpha subunit
MKPTKRAKKIDILARVIKTVCYNYHCPTCKTRFEFHWSMKKVIRFRCDCGQELIIDKWIEPQ